MIAAMLKYEPQGHGVERFRGAVRSRERPACRIAEPGFRSSWRSWVVVAFVSWLVFGAVLRPAEGQVVFSEIMYNPVETPSFNPDGTPVLDLSSDVHEFIEIHNVSGQPVSLDGWRITGGLGYAFPAGAAIGPGDSGVVATDPARLADIAAYDLLVGELFGPYEGQLSNSGELVRLRNAQDDLVDAVRYADSFPWAIGADGLGASERWTGLSAEGYRYRGRSLERVSFTHSGHDPANWLASPSPGDPSPGRPNTVQRAVPRPIVISFSVYQNSDEQPVIREGQAVRVDCAFSATNDLADVRIEYFIVDLNTAGVATTTLAMTPVGDPANAHYTGLLPSFSNRQVVRYRFLAERGNGVQPVSPRPDDPFAWHAFFVTPVRSSPYPIYDVFISDESWNRLATNINFGTNQRRVVPPDPPGYPRESWDATEPAIFVHDNVVYETHMRHRGSRWGRSAGRSSFKFFFPRYARFRDSGSWLVADKGNDTVAGHGLFREAGLPTSTTRWVTLYRNNASSMTRLEMEVNDDSMLERYHREQSLLHPELGIPEVGEVYKSKGADIDEGPYGRADGALLPQRSIWTPMERYAWTYNLKNNDWKGHAQLRQMMDDMWEARGGKISGLNAQDIANLRQYFLAHWDVDQMLTYIVLINWMAPWDDIFHNYLLWRHSDGKWCLLPWDFDGLFGDADASLYAGEVGDRSNNFRGHNYFKDSFIKAFREELKERYFLLNNTLLHPENISALGYGQFRGFADARFVSVNNQVGLGDFHRPAQPANVSPAGGQAVTPPSTLSTSPYTHSASPARPHAATTWMIRTADGSYDEPVLHLTSTNQLTSLPVPFAELQFGDTYFWRVMYHDADGHPSLASQESSFAYGQGTFTTKLIEVDANTSWKYNQTAYFSSVQTAWRGRAYDDASWPSGAPVLGFGNHPLPEPIRTPLTSGRITYYFRTAFDFPGAGSDAVLRLRYMIDDGAVFYLNGTEILRYNMPSGSISYDTFAASAIGTAAFSGWLEVPVGNLFPTQNVLAVEVHQWDTSSSDIAFGVEVETDVAGSAGDLVLNEIMAANQTTLNNAGGYPDWVELYNRGAQTIDVGGMALSDDMLAPDRYIFPPNTLIPPQGYLLVWFDDDFDAPGLHTGFGLSQDGETVALFENTSGGYVAVDFVTFGMQLEDYAIGRVPNGSGDWGLNAPTPGAPNAAHPLGSAATLRINEWMASPVAGDDWFEVFNPDPLPVAVGGFFLSDRLDDATRSEIPALSFVEPGGFSVFIAAGTPDLGANHVDFSLSGSGEAIVLSSPDVQAIDTILFGPQDTGVSEGRLPDGNADIVRFPQSPTPGDFNYLPLSNVVISEVLAHSDPPLEDAIELHNVADVPVDISGWFLSDGKSNLQRFQIPPDAVLAPGGYTVFYEFQFNPDPGAPDSFALSSFRGDRVFLSEAVGGQLTGYRAQVEFGPSENAVSLGRFPTSQGADFVALSARTFGMDDPATLEEFRLGGGLPNAYPKVGPVIFHEVMYHPPDLVVDGLPVNNEVDEYVELHNITGAPAPLYDPEYPENTWRIDDGIRFTFPADVVIAPYGFVLVVSFDPAGDPVQHAAFRSKFNVPDAVPVLGPYSGRLSNAGERLDLLRPDRPQLPPQPDAGLVPYILVDHILYGDRDPWPLSPDGNGDSLQRFNPLAYGNEPLNWFGAAPTAGRPNLPQPTLMPRVLGSPARFELGFEAAPGQSYTIQYIDALTGNAWITLHSVAPEFDARWMALDDPLDGRHSRFYRLLSPAQP